MGATVLLQRILIQTSLCSMLEISITFIYFHPLYKYGFQGQVMKLVLVLVCDVWLEARLISIQMGIFTSQCCSVSPAVLQNYNSQRSAMFLVVLQNYDSQRSALLLVVLQNCDCHCAVLMCVGGWSASVRRCVLDLRQNVLCHLRHDTVISVIFVILVF